VAVFEEESLVREIAMDWTVFLSAMGGAAVSTGILGGLVGAWVTHRLSKIREAESRANALREKQREGCRAVADILAEWVRPTYAGTYSNEDRWKMQTTYWKNILGLDKRLINVLFPLLACAEGHLGTNEVIVRTRAVLLDLKEPDLQASNLNNWLPVTT
jgi:hypothetical protein